MRSLAIPSRNKNWLETCLLPHQNVFTQGWKWRNDSFWMMTTPVCCPSLVPDMLDMLVFLLTPFLSLSSQTCMVWQLHKEFTTKLQLSLAGQLASNEMLFMFSTLLKMEIICFVNFLPSFFTDKLLLEAYSTFHICSTWKFFAYVA